MGKELPESQARGWTRQDAGFTQFLAHKSTFLNTSSGSSYVWCQRLYHHFYKIPPRLLAQYMANVYLLLLV